MDDLIRRQDAIDSMWKALYAYEDLTEKQFMEHKELKIDDWFMHRIFVQRMHEECMKAVESLPSAESMGLSGQYKFERDIAMKQLAEYGIPFGMKKDEDIVKVVRCKDCIYYRDGECKSGTLPYSEYSDLKNAWLMPKPDDYCSYGERQVMCK